MSLVGTRPPTVDEWEQYELHHRSRMSTKPGITGMWQVSGRSDITDFEEVVRLDTEYIENWTIGLDIKILMKTVLAVGLPCISTDCPTGPKELLGANERGILVKPGDKEDLAVAIKYSLENVEEMKQKADLAKSYIVKRFSPSKISEMLVSELEKIIF